MKGIVVGSIVSLLLLCGIAYGQFPPIYPTWQDGFDTALVTDMSFATEVHIQSFPPNNFSMFIYGSGRVKTIYPDPQHGYVVTNSPNELWDLPWIDLQVVQNGTDLWGFGPIDPIGPPHTLGGYSLDIGVLTTKYFQHYSDYRFSPLALQGTFFSVRPVILPFNNSILAYFVGFFPNASNPLQLQYGVVRAWFNMALDTPSTNYTDHWVFNTSTDVAVMNPYAQLVTFNAFYKPMIHHMWNVTGAASPNQTYTIVIEPGTYWVDLILGDFNPAVPLTVSSLNWSPNHIGVYGGRITSSKVYYPFSILILGIGVEGTGTGAIAFVHAFNLTTRGVLSLPGNFSDPKALAVDEFNHTLYVGMNGGYALLRIDIHTMNITGWQNLPPYLTRSWSAQVTLEHVYFLTNEQHTKVFRVNKQNFCPSLCPEFGWCERGKCVCGTGFQMVDDKCEWAAMIVEKHTVKKEKAGEAVLGVFFALSFVAAAVGWFLVWKHKRQGYQAV